MAAGATSVWVGSSPEAGRRLGPSFSELQAQRKAPVMAPTARTGTHVPARWRLRRLCISGLRGSRPGPGNTLREAGQQPVLGRPIRVARALVIVGEGPVAGRVPGGLLQGTFQPTKPLGFLAV